MLVPFKKCLNCLRRTIWIRQWLRWKLGLR